MAASDFISGDLPDLKIVFKFSETRADPVEARSRPGRAGRSRDDDAMLD
jgi:hypothetical protein